MKKTVSACTHAKKNSSAQYYSEAPVLVIKDLKKPFNPSTGIFLINDYHSWRMPYAITPHYE
jgi:hypothetical protein